MDPGGGSPPACSIGWGTHPHVPAFISCLAPYPHRPRSPLPPSAFASSLCPSVANCAARGRDSCARGAGRWGDRSQWVSSARGGSGNGGMHVWTLLGGSANGGRVAMCRCRRPPPPTPTPVPHEPPTHPQCRFFPRSARVATPLARPRPASRHPPRAAPRSHPGRRMLAALSPHPSPPSADWNATNKGAVARRRAVPSLLVEPKGHTGDTLFCFLLFTLPVRTPVAGSCSERPLPLSLRGPPTPQWRPSRRLSDGAPPSSAPSRPYCDPHPVGEGTCFDLNGGSTPWRRFRRPQPATPGDHGGRGPHRRPLRRRQRPPPAPAGGSAAPASVVLPLEAAAAAATTAPTADVCNRRATPGSSASGSGGSSNPRRQRRTGVGRAPTAAGRQRLPR